MHYKYSKHFLIVYHSNDNFSRMVNLFRLVVYFRLYQPVFFIVIPLCFVIVYSYLV
jgi:hypothetical protein